MSHTYPETHDLVRVIESLKPKPVIRVIDYMKSINHVRVKVPLKPT